mgnify:CR=1 FL=1
MKSLAIRLAIHHAVGLHLGEQEVVLRQVAATPLGPRETACRRAACSPGGQGEAVESLLEPLLAGDERRPVRIGVALPASRVFFATRPLRALGEDARPEVLLQRAMQSPTVSIDDLVVELIKVERNKIPMASMAACRRKYLSEVLAVLGRHGVRPFCVEPAPCALLRAAVQQHHAPRKAKTVLRVFLDGSQGLAVVVAGDLPVAWRSFGLPRGREGAEIVCVKRTLETLGRHYGTESPPDAVLIHGRPDLHAQFGEEPFREEMGSRVLCYDGPSLDGAEIAMGAALNCLEPDDAAFDLSRSLKPRPSLREIFPWSELTLQVALLIVMGALLGARSLNVHEAYQAARTAAAQHECLASASPRELEKEKKDLSAKVDAVRRFLESRILWTAYTHDLPGRLPADAMLTSLHGLCELEYFGKKKEGTTKPKKSLVLRATAPVKSDGTMPREIDEFLVALRNHPLLKRDFPDVELADIKRYQLFQGAQPMANFTVVCLPKTEWSKAGSSKSEDRKGDGAKKGEP